MTTTTTTATTTTTTTRLVRRQTVTTTKYSTCGTALIPLLLLLVFLGVSPPRMIQVQACPYLKNQQQLHHDAAVTASSLGDDNANTKEGRQRRGLPAATTTTTGRRHRSRRHRQLVFEPFIDFFLAIFDFILRSLGLGGPDTVAEAIDQARADILDLLDNDRAAEMLRLAFHDCTDNGVCNGCLDMTNVDNTGLADPILDLQPIVNKYAAFLTRGDIWVLAAYVALERQQGQSNLAQNSIVPFDLTFVGRPSCANPNTPPADILPSAHLNTAGLTTYFATTFGFDNRETAAIMGAHTLGRAVLANSGFNGQAGWVNNRNAFDNQFYRTLLTNGGMVNTAFVQELQSNVAAGRPFPDQFLWRHTGGGGGGGGNNLFMLNADMSLAVDFGTSLAGTNGAVTCTLRPGEANSCGASALLTHAQAFAANDVVWRQAFHDAFVKITNLGCTTSGTCTVVS